jgi:AraC family cel operon transcriptional repressor
VAPWHGHDFAELCWVERGQLRQQTDRSEVLLKPGDAVLIEAGHVHRLEGCPGGATIVNIALRAEYLEELRHRWGAEVWPCACEPTLRHGDPESLIALTRRCDELLLLEPEKGGVFQSDMLIGYILQILQPVAARPWGELPPWLDSAVALLEHPPGLVEGLSLLPRLTGRSREHISRAIRQACARSPSTLLQEFRLRWAERSLVQGYDSVEEIGRSSGFQGRAHFYRLFRSRFGMTPAAYRRQARRTLGG